MAAAKISKPGRHADGGGLYLVVTRSGTRHWCFRYTRGGKAHEMGLGSFNTINLAEARGRARHCRQQLLDGTEPLAQKRAERSAGTAGLTFGAVANLYVAAHAPAWRSPIHARQWRNSLRDHVMPAIGQLPVTAIDTGIMMRILRTVVARETGDRVARAATN